MSTDPNLANFITVADDANGSAVLKVDRDGSANNTYSSTDLLVLENQAGLTLEQLLTNGQIIIG